MAAWRSSSQRSTVRAGPDGLRATGTARQRDPGAGHVNETPAAHARRRRGVCGRRRHAWLAEGRAAGAGVALLGAGRDDPGRQCPPCLGKFRYGSARQSRHSWLPGGKWGASVARCPPNRAYRLCSDSERLCVVIGTCHMAHNGGTMPSERYIFTARVEPVSPPCLALLPRWWRRRALPPGPLRLFHAPFIAIASEPAGLI